MNGEQVREQVQRVLDNHESVELAYKVARVSEQPINGYWQVLVEPTRSEPQKRYQYYELLAEIEEELSDEDLKVFLTPAPEGSYEYKIGDATIEVKEREGTLYVAPKRSGHISAVYDPSGRYLFSNGVGRVNESSTQIIANNLADWRSRFDEAIRLYLDEKGKAAD